MFWIVTMRRFSLDTNTNIETVFLQNIGTYLQVHTMSKSKAISIYSSHDNLKSHK